MAWLGRDAIEASVRRALAQPRGERLLAFVAWRHRSVSRFANSIVHQAMDEENVRVEFRARAACGAPIIFATHDFDATSLRNAAKRAIEAGAEAAWPRRDAIVDDAGYSEASAASTHEARAEAIRDAFATSPSGVTFAGIFAVHTYEFAVVGSEEATSAAQTSKAFLNVYGIGPRGDEGYASAASRDVGAIDTTRLVTVAADRALRASAPKRRVDRGAIDVVLAPDAVEEILEWAAFTGFGGKLFTEGAAFTSGRIDEQLFDGAVSLSDDGLSDDPLALRMPFDCEGVPKRRLTLVERGVVLAVAHDHETASRVGAKSTGHAAHEDPDEGPLPRHIFLERGATSTFDLIAGVDHGLWVTKFHYVNGLVNPREGAMTGLTRGGAFLIEHGKLTSPVETMRFSDRFPAFFSRVIAIGSEAALVPSWISDAGGVVVPPIAIRGLAFE